MDLAIDAALVTISSAYAAWLRAHKRHEPDWTWISVVAGTALCLAAAGAQSRLCGGAWHDHERRVWRAFALGGTPIIVGEVAQWLERRAERARYLQQRQ
jgi:hypothetical protein